MNTEKQALRKRLLEDIDALPEAYIVQSDEGIYKNVVSLTEFNRAETIFCYYGIGREPDTVRIIETALEMGKTVTLPVCFKGGVMEARAIEDLGELRESRIHLMEPLDSVRVISPGALDFIVVPALTYDRNGYRLGRGGGFYDRFLSGVNAFTVGVTRQRLLRDTVPCEAHDVPVACVVTEESIRRRQP
jgi:5-formyltetrahydrofolate cyclo-ligase